MARTNVPLTPLVANGGIVAPVGTTADPTNGHVISCRLTDHVLIEFINTDTGSAHVVTVLAGVSNPPAQRNSIGSVALSVPASSRGVLGPFCSAQFYDALSTGLQFNLDAGTTGTVKAWLIPKTV